MLIVELLLAASWLVICISVVSILVTLISWPITAWWERRNHNQWETALRSRVKAARARYPKTTTRMWGPRIEGLE